MDYMEDYVMPSNLASGIVLKVKNYNMSMNERIKDKQMIIQQIKQMPPQDD